MRGMLIIAAGALALTGVVSSCGSSDGTKTGEASVPGTATPVATDPHSDPTSPTTTGPPLTIRPASTLVTRPPLPLPPPPTPATTSVDLSGGSATASLPPLPTTTTVLSFPMPEPLAAEYQGSARIVETAGQAQLAYGIDSSYPPGVWFGIPLIGWDWEQVDGESTDGHKVWTDERYSVVGSWDGTRLTVTRTPSPATDDVESPLPSAGEVPTPGCELADAQSAVASDEAVAAGLAFVGPPSTSGGDCFVFAIAVIDNPELRAVLAPLGDRVHLDYLLQPAR